MTNPTPLSPAAKAIANAIEPLDWESGHCSYEDIRFISRQVAAAALRAAADQVISPVSPPCEDFDEYAQGFLAAHIKYRYEFLAIAAELGGAQ